MPTSTPRFPLTLTTKRYGWRGLLGWEVEQLDSYHTTVISTRTGREARTAEASRNTPGFKLRWSVLRDNGALAANQQGNFPQDEYKVLRGFFNQMRGRAGVFGFRNPWDARVVDQVLAPLTPAIGSDPTNPTSRVYEVVRTFGNTGYADTQPVGILNEGTDAEAAPIIRVGGSPVNFTPNAILDVDGVTLINRDGWIVLDIAPPPNVSLNGTFAYYWRCRFKEDGASWTAFARDFWEQRQLELAGAWY